MFFKPRFFMLSVSGLILGLFLSRGHLFAPLAERFIVSQAQAHLGLKIALGEISGSLVSDIKIHDVHTTGRDQSGAIVSMSAAEITAAYDPRSLASGWPDFLHSLSIKVRGLKLTLDLDRLQAPPPGQEAAPVRLPPVELQGCQVTLVRKNLQAQAVFDAKLREGDARTERLQVGMPGNVLRAEHAEWPLSLIFGGGGPAAVRGLRGVWSAELSDVPAMLKLAGFQSPEAPTHCLRLQGEAGDGEVRLQNSSLEAGAGRILLRRAVIPLSWQGRRLQDLPLRVEMQIDLRDLDSLAFIPGWPGVRGRLAGDIRLRGSLANPDGDFDLRGDELFFRGWPIGSLAAHGRAQAGKIASDLKLANQQARLTADGAWIIRTGRLENVRLSAAIGNVRDYLKPWLRAQGSLRAALNVSGPVSGPDLRAELQLENGRLGEVEIQTAVLEARNSGRQLSIRRALLQSGEGRLQASGLIDWDPAKGVVRLRLDTLALARARARLALTQAASLSRTQAGDYLLQGFDLEGNAGNLSIQGRFSPRRSSEAGLRLTDFDSRPWQAGSEPGQIYCSGADLECKLTGSLVRPRISASGRVAGIGRGDAPYTLSSEFAFASMAGRLHIRQLRLMAEGSQFLSLSGSLPSDPVHGQWLGPGALDLSGRIEFADLSHLTAVLPNSESLAGSLEGDLLLAGTSGRPRGRCNLTAHKLHVPAAWGTWPGPIEALARLEAHSSQSVAGELQVQAPGLEFSAAGKWLDAPLGNMLLGRRLRDFGRLEVQNRLAVADLRILAKTLGVPRLAGRLEAAGTLAGPAVAPQIKGDIRLSNGEIRLGSDIPPMRDLQAEARAVGHCLILAFLKGDMGGSGFDVSGDFNWQDPQNPRLNLKLEGKNLLLARSRNFMARGDTALSAQGPISSLDISGRVELTEGGYFQAFDFFRLLPEAGRPPLPKGFYLFSLPQPPLNSARLHIRISSSRPFKIRNNLVTGSVRPELMLAGTGLTPVLQGEIYLDPTRVAFPAGWLTMTKGVMVFPALEPERPVLGLQGQGKIKGYDISIQVQGPLDAPDVVLSSVPALSREDLLLLLFSGITPEQSLRTLAQRENILNLALYLGKGAITEWFSGGTEAGAETLMDRFDLEVGAGVTQGTGNTFEASFRLLDNVFQKGNSLSITSERDELDRYNMGVKLDFQFP